MWATIGNFILNFVLKKIVAFLSALAAMVWKREKIDKDTSDKAKKMKDAKTGEEIDDATDDMLSKL